MMTVIYNFQLELEDDEDDALWRWLKSKGHSSLEDFVWDAARKQIRADKKMAKQDEARQEREWYRKHTPYYYPWKSARKRYRFNFRKVKDRYGEYKGKFHWWIEVFDKERNAWKKIEEGGCATRKSFEKKTEIKKKQLRIVGYDDQK